jgi:heme-degrading monooxygenase HmoA
MPIVITGYEIDPDAAAPPAPPGRPGRRVFRAAQPGARFGYLEIDDCATADDAAELVRLIATVPEAVAGRYEIFHVGDRPAARFAADGAGSSIMFINCMACSPDQDDAAFAAWRRVNEYMVTKPGYRWHQLHRRVGGEAPFALINVVEWESADAWAAAHDDGFRALAVRPDLPFVPYATLCRPVTEHRGAERQEPVDDRV